MAEDDRGEGAEHMTERTVRGTEPVEVAASDHLLTTLWQRDAEHRLADAPLLSRPRDGGWEAVSHHEVVERVRAVAAGLIAVGVEPGDRVALMSPTRLEWVVADLAILAAGAVAVPIYDTSSEDQCRAILADSSPRLAFAADDDLAKLLDAAGSAEGRLDDIVVFDDGGLGRLARAATDAHRDEVERRVAALRGSDLATIVYTSGTTGDPKGCLLTHRNLIWTARQTVHRLDGVLLPGDTTLLFLPLAHVFTRLVQYVALEAGVQVGFARSLDDLREDLQSFRPTFLLAVPRVFEKLFSAAQRQATGLRRPIFDFAVSSGEQWSTATDPSALLRVRRAVSDRLVYSRLRAAVGGNVRFCVSGGAALNPKLGHFFNAAGITILEGYGLTETSAPATLNTPSEMRIGTVGRPIPGVSIRTAPDGELLVSGGNVFGGYHRNEQATDEALDDGWLRTGDVGAIDDDGYVVITDRKKELIVTANGKNVAPAPLEQRIREHPLVANAMVVGDDRPFLSALVAIDTEQLAALGLQLDDPEVERQVQEAIDTANTSVSRAESVRVFRLLDRDFSQDEGELTHTMKLRRRAIAELHAEMIESIYADR
jgi:long-chain acyl-CoA synthetase